MIRTPEAMYAPHAFDRSFAGRCSVCGEKRRGHDATVQQRRIEFGLDPTKSLRRDLDALANELGVALKHPGHDQKSHGNWARGAVAADRSMWDPPNASVQYRDMRPGYRIGDDTVEAVEVKSKVKLKMSSGDTRTGSKTSAAIVAADSIDAVGEPYPRNFVPTAAVAEAAARMNDGKVPQGTLGESLKGAVADWTAADYPKHPRRAMGTAAFEFAFKNAMDRGPKYSDNTADTLVRALDNAPPADVSLHRGMYVSSDSPVLTNDILDAGPGSWSAKPEVAAGFASIANGQRQAKIGNDVPVLVEMKPGAQALRIDHMAGDYKAQAEWISGGKLKVTSRETREVTADTGETFEAVVMTVEQT